MNKVIHVRTQQVGQAEAIPLLTPEGVPCKELHLRLLCDVVVCACIQQLVEFVARCEGANAGRGCAAYTEGEVDAGVPVRVLSDVLPACIRALEQTAP